MKQILLALALMIGTSGCAALWDGHKGGPSFESRLQSWVGKDSSELIATWGAPASTYELPNGNKMYTFVSASNPMATTTYNQYMGAQTMVSQRRCQVDFIADTSNIVRTWRWQGNACE